ncbi:MAG TPA: HEAT repeat domain-containing protein [Thermodesulfobacteriota bacterium]
MRRTEHSGGSTVDPLLEGFLGELARAYKATLFYPPAHPALRVANEKVREAHERFQAGRDADSTEPVELGVGRRGFTENGRLVGGQVPGVADLAHECVVRRVSRLYLRRGATADELGHLLHLLTVDPEDLARDGGFEACLAEAGVRAIWANQADLDAILAKLERASAERAEPRTTWTPPQAEAGETGETGETGDAVGDAGASQEAAPAPEPERMTAEQQLLALLARLDRETDGVAYQQTIEKLRWTALELRNTAPFDTLLPAIAVLGQHAGGSTGRRGAAQQQMADALLAELIDEPLLTWLVERVGSREARGEREVLGRALTRLGARALGALLDALSTGEDRAARRALSQVITLFGESAVPELELRLRDSRWFVVRNMATLLGELRSRGSVPALTALLAHEDIRVRRAAVQALSKIGGPRARGEVVGCLTSDDPEIQVHAILAVGAWREASALPTLEAIARGKPVGANRRPANAEVRRHAIEALGLVGGAQAVEALGTLLEPPGLLRRLFGRAEPPVVRIAAAEALAAVGSPEARRLLRAAAEDRGAVGERCRELAATLG